MAYPTLWGCEHPLRARPRWLRATLVLLATGFVTLAYAALAYHVVFDLHIGHVVQDGVDTGDLLALPFLVAATASLVFGLYWTSSLISAPRAVPSRPRASAAARGRSGSVRLAGSTSRLHPEEETPSGRRIA